MELNAATWNEFYLSRDTGWDAGGITMPLKKYFDGLENKKIKILIPGAGNAHEAEYLHRKNFSDVYVLDWAEEPIKNVKSRLPDFPSGHLIRQNFFDHSGQYDLIVEQTFFCALDPSLRPQYAQHMHELLKPGGKLVGVLFFGELNKDHPPFGGTKEEYLRLFEPLFSVKVLDICYNSIPPRAGRELFIYLEKK